MKKRGLSLTDIADELQIPVREVSATINDRFKKEAEHQTTEDRDAILAMENDRLDYYLTKIWDQIEYGDLKAITTALGIHDRKVKINQLDKMDSASGQNAILVIGGAEEDYVEKLKRLADGG